MFTRQVEAIIEEIVTPFCMAICEEVDKVYTVNQVNLLSVSTNSSSECVWCLSQELTNWCVCLVCVSISVCLDMRLYLMIRNSWNLPLSAEKRPWNTSKRFRCRSSLLKVLRGLLDFHDGDTNEWKQSNVWRIRQAKACLFLCMPTPLLLTTYYPSPPSLHVLPPGPRGAAVRTEKAIQARLDWSEALADRRRDAQ